MITIKYIGFFNRKTWKNTYNCYIKSIGLKSMKNSMEILNQSAGIYSVRVNWLCGIKFLSSNVFVLNSSPGSGILVIDTGARGSGKIIADAIIEAGLRPRDIKGIALSHWHSDHTGSVSELLSIAAEDGASEVSVFIHKDDSIHFPGGKEGTLCFHPFFKIPLHHKPGKIPAEDLCGFVLLDEHSAENPLLPWGLEIIHVPGHTPGNISFFHRETGSLFCGSGLALVDGRTVGIMSVFDNREEQVRSAQKLAAMDFRYLYPAHLHIRKDPIPPEQRIPVKKISFMHRVKGIKPLFRYE